MNNGFFNFYFVNSEKIYLNSVCFIFKLILQKKNYQSLIILLQLIIISKVFVSFSFFIASSLFFFEFVLGDRVIQNSYSQIDAFDIMLQNKLFIKLLINIKKKTLSFWIAALILIKGDESLTLFPCSLVLLCKTIDTFNLSLFNLYQV